jgi:hypothetical protein
VVFKKSGQASTPDRFDSIYIKVYPVTTFYRRRSFYCLSCTLPEILKKRRKAGDWTPRSALVNNVSQDFEVIRGKTDVAKCTIHDLRRSAITNWAIGFTRNCC